MITVTKTIDPKVRLTKAQIASIKKLVVDSGNTYKACDYAAINYRTLIKAIAGAPIKGAQKDKLVKFCDLLEGKTAA